jgi:hypothetical protein
MFVDDRLTIFRPKLEGVSVLARQSHFPSADPLPASGDPMRQSQLTHYLAEAGATRFVTPGELSPRMLEFGLHFMSDGLHLIPAAGYHFFVSAFRGVEGWIDGAHCALVYEARVVATFTTCLNENVADVLWARFESYYFGATDRGLLAQADWPVPKKPQVAPWVASFPLKSTKAELQFVAEFVPAWACALAITAEYELKRVS